MEEQEIKRMLKDTEEGPSYGFSQKTMRKIMQLEAGKSVFGVKGHKSKIAIITPLILAVLMLGSLLLLDPQFEAFNKTHIWFTKLQSLIVVNYFWLSSALLIVIGFWSWILWEKRLQKKT
ncbi:hypothetical protein GCM10011506_34480 [Marivirga lumbricoides]|uniref:Uncharacterized protein n=2 Tax=Marivirga lumbricoides TaxID=1046115 RepID=A0ABQ1MVY0_9BACT|nr:hypothetical protein GCM10011506_34480 [Marivirga lumbricoides]